VTARRAPAAGATDRSARAAVRVTVALALLAAGQLLSLTGRGLPDDVALVVRDGGYTVATPGDPDLVSFQLDSTGRAVEVVGVSVDVPGLRLVDVVAAGSATGGRALGEGAGDLPGFRLADSVTLTLRLEVTDCDAVDDAQHLVVVRVRDGRRAGDVALALRDYPDPEGVGADLRWQQVLALAACPSTDRG
jgi:hypothetical protein